MPDIRDPSSARGTTAPALPAELTPFAEALAERYAIQRELGRGGMATVYLARDIRHDRLVALKVLNAELGAILGVERFLAEIKVTANLQHPNLLPLFDSGGSAGLLFYVMPYVDGETLRSRLEREKQLPVDEALRIAVAVANALDYAHRHGVIHRDLKPENILLQAGQPVIADFGIALAVSNAGGQRITQTGLSLGTPQYMSPEQATGDRIIDGRTDVYSLGAVLYEMLTGEPPHSGTTAQAIIAKVLTDKPRAVRLTRDTVPLLVEQAVERALAKLPADRFATADQFADALGGHGIDVAQSARMAARWPTLLLKSSWRWAAAAAAALTLALGSFAAGTRAGAGAAAPATVWHGQMLGGSLVATEPRASADGQRIAFAAVVDNLTQIGVLDPVSGNWTVLTRDRSRGLGGNVAWSPDGSRIYYSRWFSGPNGVFSISPLGGDERMVLENAAQPEVLADGTLLVARNNARGLLQMHRFWPGTGRIEPLDAVSTGYHGFKYRVFGDGREVAFVGRPASDSTAPSHIYVLDLQSNRPRRVGPGVVIPPSFWFALTVSRDGQWILFNLPSGDLNRIVAIPRDGSDDMRTVVTLGASPIEIDVAADGSIYVDQTAAPHEIVRYAPATRTVHRQRIPASEDGVRPLSEGRALVAVRSGGRNRVMLIARDRDPVPFIETTEETAFPMARLGADRVLLMVGSTPNRAVAVVSMSTGQLFSRLYSEGEEPIRSLAGSPDGRTVYLSRAGTIWAMPSAGGQPRRLRTGDAVAVDPGGRYIVVKTTVPEGFQLIRVRLEDGAEEVIPVRSEFSLAPDVLAPDAVHPDGRIAVRVNSRDSWFWPAAILNPGTGHVQPIISTFDRDMTSPGWDETGTLVTKSNSFESQLWRLRPIDR